MPKPDQRAVPRLELNSTAIIQPLGTSAGANGKEMAVTVVDASEQGMRLRSAAPIDAGQAVKIEMGDAMFLGEVCYCQRATENGGDCFYLGIVTKECLSGLASLHNLVRALAPEPAKELEPKR